MNYADPAAVRIVLCVRMAAADKIFCLRRKDNGYLPNKNFF